MHPDAMATESSFEEVQPSGRSKAYIDSLGSTVSEKLEYQAGDDLAPYVERLGGEIEVRSWKKPPEDGSIQVRGQGDFTIFLSPYTGPLRDRFTIAHELGHYFLHSLLGKRRIYIRREGSNRAEWEANWFAAAFLLPQNFFRKMWEETGGNVEAIAAAADVSRQTVITRSKELELQE